MDLEAIDVLCCEIRIGECDAQNPIVINNPIVLNEVYEIEIHESYKELIGKAKIKFPKGTVFQSTIIGNLTGEGSDAGRITTEVMQDGVLIEKRKTQSVIDDKTFRIGQRVSVRLGYNGIMKNMFEGYITAYNSDSMVELDCENMAYKLKLKQAPKFETPATGTKVNEVLGDKYKLLEGTGFRLHSDTAKFDIGIGKVKVTDNFTVADILNDWSKYKVYCFLKYDANTPDRMPAIAVGRPYSSSKTQPKFPEEQSGPYVISFDYHVASNNLKVLKTDPKFLAVKGKALGIDEKFFEVTVRLNPEYDPSDANSKEFQTLNATQISKKSHKKTGNRTAKGAETKTKADLSTYTVVPYMSPNMRINSDRLVEESIEYFKNYNLNGITGNLVLFGDFGLTTAVQVELRDERNPSKNGIYIVEEVTTTFGVRGYRQKITIPHKVKGNKPAYGTIKD